MATRNNSGRFLTTLKTNFSSFSSASQDSLHSPLSPSVRETNVVVKSIHPSSGQKMINNYLVIRELGRGVHGKVKLCVDSLDNNHPYAIKIINKQGKRKFAALSSSAMENEHQKILREIAIMKKCSHPHIVQLHEVMNDPNTEKMYLVLEYVDGGELVWHDEEDEPVLDLEEIKSIMLGVCIGLDYLHHQGIVHRDIKPQNILVASVNSYAGLSAFSSKLSLASPTSTKNLQQFPSDLDLNLKTIAKIADFGVSYFSEKLIDDDVVNDVEMTRTAGSPAFFAPELCIDDSLNSLKQSDENLTEENDVKQSNQFKIGDSHDSNNPGKFEIVRPSGVGKAVDIWALGVTLYCMVYGRLPFTAQTEYELFSIIPRTEVSFPTNTKRGNLNETEPLLIDLLKKLLEKEQKKRIKLRDVKRHLWLRDEVPGLVDEQKDKWLEDTDAANFIARQIEQDPDVFAGRYDEEGRIRISKTDVEQAVTVGVFKRMVDAFRRRLSKSISWLSSSPSSASEEKSSNKWGFAKRSNTLFHSASSQSLGRKSITADGPSKLLVKADSDSDSPSKSTDSLALARPSSSDRPSSAPSIKKTHRRAVSVPVPYSSSSVSSEIRKSDRLSEESLEANAVDGTANNGAKEDNERR